jgi:hypothetical protein
VRIEPPLREKERSMPGRHPPVTLRLEPHAIPAVRAAFDEAIEELTSQLARMQRTAYIREPWLGDRVSAQVAEHYNRTVMDSRDGPYAALRAFETELRKVRNNLKLLEGHYRRTEGDEVARWGRT